MLEWDMFPIPNVVYSAFFFVHTCSFCTSESESTTYYLCFRQTVLLLYAGEHKGSRLNYPTWYALVVNKRYAYVS